MDAERKEDDTSTTAERKSDRELVVTRTFNAPGAHRVRGLDHARAVQAMVGAEIVRHDPAFLRNGCAHSAAATVWCSAIPASEQPMAFFGRYLEVTPQCPPRLDE